MTPATRATISPLGNAFSANTNTAMRPIQSRFITPAANSSRVSIQQQPVQEMPWSKPMWSASPVPSRHPLTAK